jgi:hypothetical protein
MYTCSLKIQKENILLLLYHAHVAMLLFLYHATAINRQSVADSYHYIYSFLWPVSQPKGWIPAKWVIFSAWTEREHTHFFLLRNACTLLGSVERESVYSTWLRGWSVSLSAQEGDRKGLRWEHQQAKLLQGRRELWAHTALQHWVDTAVTRGQGPCSLRRPGSSVARTVAAIVYLVPQAPNTNTNHAFMFFCLRFPRTH